MNLTIDKEEINDYNEVEKVVEEAFKNAEHTDHSEHILVNRLRKVKEFIPELSLVAKDDDKIVGHIMLTKINIKSENTQTESLALAPVSVLPEYQDKGIGSKLINESLKIAKKLGFKSIIVLGHDKYYPKFGFERASKYSISAPFDVPDSSFMALELVDNALNGVNGVVIYSDAFLG